MGGWILFLLDALEQPVRRVRHQKTAPKLGSIVCNGIRREISGLSEPDGTVERQLAAADLRESGKRGIYMAARSAAIRSSDRLCAVLHTRFVFVGTLFDAGEHKASPLTFFTKVDRNGRTITLQANTLSGKPSAEHGIFPDRLVIDRLYNIAALQSGVLCR